DRACDYYPGLEYVRSESQTHDFDWPTVDAVAVEVPTGSDGRDRGQTELKQLGYDTTKSRSRRWTILKRILDRSEMRLEEVAGTIAWYCHNCRRQYEGEYRYRRALREWEYDLHLLKSAYYDGGRYQFSWPTTHDE